jgi:hypothetical protein
MSGVATAPPTNVMNSRRLIAPTDVEDSGSYRFATTSTHKIVVKLPSRMSALGHKQHSHCNSQCRLAPDINQGAGRQHRQEALRTHQSVTAKSFV